MQIHPNISLATLTTMRTGGLAKFLIELKTRDDIREAFTFIRAKNLPWFVLSGGSNIIATGDFPGVILLNRLRGFREISNSPESELRREPSSSREYKDSARLACPRNFSDEEKSIKNFSARNVSREEDGEKAERKSHRETNSGKNLSRNSAFFRIGAGEITDEIIAKLTAKNLSGVECLSLIPGRIGALPVQNVGAYGQEIAQTLRELTVFNTETNKFETLSNKACHFSYRDSIFKSRKNRKYIITDITLELSRKNLQPPFYDSLQKYLDEHNIRDFSPQNIRDAVIAIRESKLPDIATLPNTGSFFKNPILTADSAKTFLTKCPDAPHWPMPDGQIKLAAGWLMDRADLKGFAKYGFQIYPKHALVVTNPNHGTAENLAKFLTEINQIIRAKFDLTLEQEPENL